MTRTNTNILMILAVTLGLALSIMSTAHASDAGPKLLSDDMGTADDLATPEIEKAAEPEVLAVGLNPAKDNPSGTAKDVYDSLKGGQYLIGFGGFLMFIVWGVRTFFARKQYQWARGELAGNVIAFGTAFVLATATALFAGQGLSLGLFTAAAAAAYAAKGNWTHIKAAKDSKK